MRVRAQVARTDVDLGALSRAQQRRLGDLYSVADPVAAKAIRQMDADALSDLSKLDVDADLGRQLAPKYAELDATERERLNSLIENRGIEHARMAAEIDGDELGKLLGCSGSSGGCDTEFLDRVAEVNDRYDDVDAGSLVKTYNDLAGEYESSFRELAKHDIAGDSWIRTVSSNEIDSDAVQNAIDEVEAIGSEGSLQRFATGSDVNREFPEDYEDPYTPDSIAVEFETATQRTYLRAHGPDNKIGGFLAREDTLYDSSGNLLSQSEIQDVLSLQNQPTQVSKVDVPEGYELRAGEIKANFGGQQGASQIELIDDDRIPTDNFYETESLPTK